MVERKDFEALLSFMQDGAEKLVAEDRQVQPMIFAWKPGTGVQGIMQPPVFKHYRGREQDFAAAIIRTALSRDFAPLMGFLSEAWFVSRPKLQDRPGSSLEHAPDRQEGVLMVLYSKDEEFIVINPIQRNPSRMERGKIEAVEIVGGRFSMLSE